MIELKVRKRKLVKVDKPVAHIIVYGAGVRRATQDDRGRVCIWVMH